MKYEIGDMVIMSPSGSSYISTMRETFRSNPEARIVDIKEHDRVRLNGEHYTTVEYRIVDCNHCKWTVMESEILHKVNETTVFI